MTRDMASGLTGVQAQKLAELLAAAEHGDGAAACELGDLCRDGGGGLPPSPSGAFNWYMSSALAGHANGQHNLAACYEHGIGCEQSHSSADYWYRKAAARRPQPTNRRSPANITPV